MRHVGLIGLGNAGKPIAQRLLQAGFSLRVYDLNRKAVEEMAEQGALPATSPKGATTEVTITVLPSSSEVDHVASGQSGILDGIKGGTIWIDFSGTDPDCARRVERQVVQRGGEFIGGTLHAAGAPAVTIPEGLLSIAVGGKAEVIESCREVLQTIGQKVICLPEAWMPKSLKIAVIMMSVAATIAAAECATWLSAQGLDPRLFLRLLQETGSSASASRMESFFRRHISHGGMLRNSKKDLSQALKLASDRNLPLPLTALAEQIQQQAMDKGLEKVNTPAAMGKLYEMMTGVDLGFAVLPGDVRLQRKSPEAKMVKIGMDERA